MLQNLREFKVVKMSLNESILWLFNDFKPSTSSSAACPDLPLAAKVYISKSLIWGKKVVNVFEIST